MHKKIGLGGGCHWCTEAVFTSLKGAIKVEQGFIQSTPPHESFSEAVTVTFDTDIISLSDLIEIHVHTHASASVHSMRHKYRSAIYYFDDEDKAPATYILEILQPQFKALLITIVLPFVQFKQSLPQHLNYYYNDPDKPFCKMYIHPKLQLLKQKYTKLTDIK